MKKLKIILYIIYILIFLLLIGNIVLFIVRPNNEDTNNSDLDARLETITYDLSEYGSLPEDERNEDEYLRIESELKNITDSTKNQDVMVGANIQLAFLYSYKDGDADRSIGHLDSLLKNNDLLDQNKYAILNAKLGFYTESDDTANIKSTLKEILKLPETMKLPSEDWSATREYYKMELERLDD